MDPLPAGCSLLRIHHDDTIHKQDKDALIVEYKGISLVLEESLWLQKVR